MGALPSLVNLVRFCCEVITPFSSVNFGVGFANLEYGSTLQHTLVMQHSSYIVDSIRLSAHNPVMGKYKAVFSFACTETAVRYKKKNASKRRVHLTVPITGHEARTVFRSPPTLRMRFDV